jgi:hypothetical protein
MNYFFLEYFRALTGTTPKTLMTKMGQDPERAGHAYTDMMRAYPETTPEKAKAFAEALGISEAWLTHAPVVFSKSDLDNYLAIYLKRETVPLIRPTDKGNQYEIVSMPLAMELSEIAEKRAHSTPSEWAAYLLHAAKVDPEYQAAPLRSVLDYAILNYDSIPAFAKAFVSQAPDLKPSQTDAITAKLVMAQSLPTMKFDKKLMRAFADFSNKTYDQVACDFRISSIESVVNLFLVVAVLISDWTISENDKGSTILTLTDPRYLPSEVPSISDLVPGLDPTI